MPNPDVLFIDDERVTAPLVPKLRNRCTVTVMSTIDTARQFLQRARPALVIMEIDVGNGAAADICRQAKSLNPAPAVLVITAAVQKVPDALAAGCDSVLLKPFQPNLFYQRVGRLLRAYSAGLGTNRLWPDTHCPHCDRVGVTSFEFAAHGREWYACLHCQQVWVAKCQD
jgi:DNA-binding response OmpR family regulator